MNSEVYVLIIYILYLRIMTQRPPVGQGLLIHGVQITNNDAPQSVELLWTSDQLVAETYTWQHTTLTTDIHPRWSKEEWSDNITNELRVLKLFMETDLRNICTLYEDFFFLGVYSYKMAVVQTFSLPVSMSAELNMYNVAHW